uniref:Uncharacterized protein n=1 Tax=Anguilla anguilla TaxID=7936 RepID=A0A0E9W3M9_ANGAN
MRTLRVWSVCFCHFSVNFFLCLL